MSVRHKLSGSRSNPSRRLRVKVWNLTSDAIDVGVACGIRRWEKYRDTTLADTDREALIDHLVRELGNAFADRFVFDNL